jgi:uncharacterized protein (TIGR02117 family)
MKLILWKLTMFCIVFIILCFLFVVFYLLLARLLSFFTTNPKKVACENPLTIYASSNGVHMDLILHKDHLDPGLLAQIEIVEGMDYIAIGWGDKGFYLYTPSWAELKVSTALIAAFWPSETVMHVTYHQSINLEWKTITLCKSQLSNLNNFIYKSFAEDSKHKIQILKGAGFTQNDFFYQAKGNYTCFYTCNVWVNQALKKAKVKTAIWSPFDKGILKHL